MKKLYPILFVIALFAHPLIGQITPIQTISNSANEFGRSIDVLNDYMIVGGDGSAFIYHKVNGQWQQMQELTMADCDWCRDTAFIDSFQGPTRLSSYYDTVNKTYSERLRYEEFGTGVGLIDGYAVVGFKRNKRTISKEFDPIYGFSYRVSDQDIDSTDYWIQVYKLENGSWLPQTDPDLKFGKILDTEGNKILIANHYSILDLDQMGHTGYYGWLSKVEIDNYLVSRENQSWTKSFISNYLDADAEQDVSHWWDEFDGDLAPDGMGCSLSPFGIFVQQPDGSWETEEPALGWRGEGELRTSYNGTFAIFSGLYNTGYGYIWRKEGNLWNDDFLGFYFGTNSLRSDRFIFQRHDRNNQKYSVEFHQIANDSFSFKEILTDPSASPSSMFGEQILDADQQIFISSPGNNQLYIYDTNSFYPPQTIKRLRLLSLCSPNPAVERRWRVKNLNSFPVEYIWAQWWSDQRDTLIAPPGLSYFYTQTNAQDPTTGAGLGIYGDDNITGLWWVDENNQTASTWDFPNEDQCNLRFAEPTANQKGSFQPGEISLTFPNMDILKGENLAIAYPNPSTGIIHVESKIPSTLRVFNMTGQLLIDRSGETALEEQELNLSQLPAGVYLLEVSNEIQSQMIRIIKQ